MLKKTIKYTDYNDIEQTEDFYFNLTKAELAKMELTTDGGYVEHLSDVATSGKGSLIIAEFESLIKRSYGKRSEDGSRFIKNEEVYEEFSQSEAYSEFFLELVTDAEAASEFVEALIPKDLADAVDKDARKLSEEKMQGFNQAKVKAEPKFEKTPELPAAEPMLEEPVAEAQPEVDLTKLSSEELIAMVQRSQQSALK